MWARQCAWLAATPEGSKKTRAAELRALDPEHPDLALPPVSGLGYLVEYWQELGLVFPSGFGPVPLPFQEIRAWAELTRTDLTPWECLALRRLSSEYVQTLSRATSRQMIAPYKEDDLETRRAVVDQAFRELARQHQAYDGHRKTKR